MNFDVYGVQATIVKRLKFEIIFVNVSIFVVAMAQLLFQVNGIISSSKTLK